MCTTILKKELLVNTTMAKGWGEGGGDQPLAEFSSFSREREELLLHTKFLAVGSSLGNGAAGGEGGGGVATPLSISSPILLTTKMTFNLNMYKFWYGVR